MFGNTCCITISGEVDSYAEKSFLTLMFPAFLVLCMQLP